MSHHSAQDIAAMAAIPNMRVYLPSDRFQTEKLFKALLCDKLPSYVRVGRNPVEDIYSEENCPFEMDKAVAFVDGVPVAGTASWADEEFDAAIVACGEMVRPAVEAAALLKEQGKRARSSGHVLREAS